ncbi:MAG: NADPH:quinone oxidoreductase family protein [Leptospiraceae bacterium]|nr:NADPH:quinone oxidoreductase family protein [Leptospiraceae bacterium]
MKSWLAEAWCEPQELVLKDIPVPEPAADELLIRVEACGMNFPDILLIAGKYQARPKRPFAPGAEVAGTIEKAGADASASFAIGQRVVAVSMIGGYAQFAVVKATQCWQLPDNMPFTEAAGMMVTYQSSWFAVVERGQTKAGETLLVHAAAGGIGTAAVQIGKALGARVIGTASSAEKLELVRQEGADEVVSYLDAGWHGKIRKELGGADVVIDPVGGDIFAGSLKCINFNGRLVIVGFTSGEIQQIPANLLLIKNVSAVGLHWNIYLADHPAKIKACTDQLFDWYAAGKIRPVVDREIPMQTAREALVEIGSRKSKGKYVLCPWQ